MPEFERDVSIDEVREDAFDAESRGIAAEWDL
jgi:hypothetical protein